MKGSVAEVTSACLCGVVTTKLHMLLYEGRNVLSFSIVMLRNKVFLRNLL